MALYELTSGCPHVISPFYSSQRAGNITRADMHLHYSIVITETKREWFITNRIHHKKQSTPLCCESSPKTNNCGQVNANTLTSFVPEIHK